MYIAIKRYETISYYSINDLRKAEEARGTFTLYFRDNSIEKIPVTRELRRFLQDNITASVDVDNIPNNLIQMPEKIER